MIYRFTNALGSEQYGVVIRQAEGGAVVVKDSFNTGKKDLPASYGYVSFEHNPFVDAEVKRDLLPLDTPVRWNDKLVADVHKAAKGPNFEQWWAEHGQEIMAQLTQREE